MIGAAQGGGDVANALQVGIGVDVQHARIEREDRRHEGGGGHGGELGQSAHVIGRRSGSRAMPDGVVDHHQAVGLAAGHAELFLVDPSEGDALVELQRALEIATELRPGDRQQPHLDAPAGLDARDQPGKAAPASFQREEARVVQQGVELVADGGVDLGDIPVERRTQPVAAPGQQPGQGFAEPGLQRLPEVRLAMKESGEIAADAGMLLGEEPAGQHVLTQGLALLERCAGRRRNRCFLTHVCRSRPSWRRVPG